MENNKLIRCYCNDKHRCDGNDWYDTSSVCMTRNLKFDYKSTKQYEYRFDYGCG